MRQWWRVVTAGVDLQDVCLLGGLTLCSVGSYWVYPPAGLIVPGTVFLWLALAPAQRRK